MSEPGTDLVVREPTPPAAGLFNTDNPKLVIKKATEAADVLKDVVSKKGLIKNISGREYILVEGWTALGAMVGVSAKTEYTRQVDDGWEAAVVVVNAHGMEIGRAEAQCLRAERNWKNRDDFAIRSMAQTRAMGKALRMPLGFIAVLAGYEATPAEEMPEVIDDVPFEETPAEPASTYVDESKVAALLELAAQLGEETHAKVVAAVAKHREGHDGRVEAGWLSRQARRLEGKLAEVVA